MRARLHSLSVFALALACGSGAPSPGATAEPAAPGAAAQPATASLAIERLDADAACDGIVPSAAPPAVEAGAPVAATCSVATSDGGGNVALACSDAIRFFGPDGAALSTATASVTALVPQPRGFHALVLDAGEVRFAAISEDGVLGASAPAAPPGLALVDARLAADPAGGAVVVSRGTHEAGNHWFELRSARRDEGGAQVSEARVVNGPDPTSPMFFAGAVAVSGETFTVWGERGTLRTAWLARDGAELAGPGDDGATADHGLGFGAAVEAAPLFDGSVALRAGGAWTRRWAPGALAGVAAPAWLASRPGTNVRHVRGGGAYALVPDAGGCEARVELLAADGRPCGAVTVAADAGACVGTIDVGRDGTLIVQPSPGTVRFWPALLR